MGSVLDKNIVVCSVSCIFVHIIFHYLYLGFYTFFKPLFSLCDSILVRILGWRNSLLFPKTIQSTCLRIRWNRVMDQFWLFFIIFVKIRLLNFSCITVFIVTVEGLNIHLQKWLKNLSFLIFHIFVAQQILKTATFWKLRFLP